MTDRDCLFCRIVREEVPADVVNRAPGLLAIRDIAPKAPVHVLVIPERHVTSLAAIGAMPGDERADMIGFIADTARREGVEEGGYRVVTNHGPHGRQSVFHLHWHIMGGAPLSMSM